MHSYCCKLQGFLLSHGWIIFHCIYIPHFLYPFICRQTGYFQIMAIVNNAAINTGVQISLWYPIFISFGYIPGSGIAGLYGNSIFNFLMNLHTVFHNGYSNFYSHQQCTKVPFPSHLQQHLLSLVFLVIAILIGMRWYCGFDLHFSNN